MKRMTSLLLALLLLFSLTGCGDVGVIGGADSPTSIIVADGSSPDQSLILPEASNDSSYTVIGSADGPTALLTQSTLPQEGEYYYDLENVVLYLEYYGTLPDNYITKKEAQALGWSGGSVERYLEGAAIGGDRFGNREGILPKEEGRSYTECDLNTDGADSRGAERLVFSNDGLYFHTEDHYETFTEVWVENGEVVW